MEKDTILYVLTKSQAYLAEKTIPSPRLDAELLLSDILNLERIKLYSNFDRKLTEEEKDEYRNRIKARGNFKPVAYITNKKYFYKSLFYVDEKVLIPRPETEELVEWSVKEIGAQNYQTVLDLCCGSGCIGISIKKDLPDIKLDMSDIDAGAISVAKMNVETIHPDSEIGIYQSDLFTSIHETYDCIVSNPPYIPESEKPEIMKDVIQYEPHLALFIKSPQEFFTEIIKEAFNHLNPNGSLYMETHPDWSSFICEKAREISFRTAEIKKDLSGKARFVKLTK